MKTSEALRDIADRLERLDPTMAAQLRWEASNVGNMEVMLDDIADDSRVKMQHDAALTSASARWRKAKADIILLGNIRMDLAKNRLQTTADNAT